MKRDDRGGRGRGSAGGEGGRGMFDDDDDYVDDLTGPPSAGSDRPAREPRKGETAGEPRKGASTGEGKSRVDWGAVDEDEDPRRGVEWEEAREASEEAPLQRRPKRRDAGAARATLVDLATPVIGCCAMLPRESGDPQPGYEALRREIVEALRRIESEAPAHGIEVEDAREAMYALTLLIDEQIAESQWTERARWMGEPLTLMMHQDPEGGVNFFRRLEALQERQAQVKEVYLVCLALGFRGKFVGLDPAQAAAELGSIRQSVLRQVHPVSIDKLRKLFPEAYREAAPLTDHVAPPPKWWLYASGGAVALALLIYIALLLGAGLVGDDAARSLRQSVGTGASAAPSESAP